MILGGIAFVGLFSLWVVVPSFIQRRRRRKMEQRDAKGNLQYAFKDGLLVAPRDFDRHWFRKYNGWAISDDVWRMHDAEAIVILDRSSDLIWYAEADVFDEHSVPIHYEDYEPQHVLTREHWEIIS